MSLYSLASDLFADMDKVRAAAVSDKASKRHQRRISNNGPRPQLLALANEGEPLPGLSAQQNDNHKGPPTLELLEGCLLDVQKIRGGASPAPVSGSKQSTTIEDDGESGHDRALLREATRNTSLLEGGLSSKSRETRDRGPFRDDSDERRTSWPMSASSSETASPTADGHTTTEERDRVQEPCTKDKTSLDHAESDNGLATDRAVVRLGGIRVDTDATATASFADFECEVEGWRASSSSRSRAEFAAYLSEKYLCGILDPMPSSPIVCRLRRQVARQIDLLASVTAPPTTTTTTTTTIATTERGEGSGVPMARMGVGENRVVAATASHRGHKGASNSQSLRTKMKETLHGSRNKSSDVGGISSVLAADGGQRGHRESLAGRWANSSRAPLRRSKPDAGKVLGNTVFTLRARGKEERQTNTTVHRDESGDTTSDDSSSDSIWRGASGTCGHVDDDKSKLPHPFDFGNDGSSSPSNTAEDIEVRKTTTNNLKQANTTARDPAPATPGKSRVGVLFPPVSAQRRGEEGNHTRTTSSCSAGTDPRARVVRFLLDDEGEKEERREGVGGKDPELLSAREPVGGGSRTQKQLAERSRSFEATVGGKVEETDDEIPEKSRVWTCSVCLQTNHEIDGEQGCPNCGRRRERRRPDKSCRAKLSMATTGPEGAGSTRHPQARSYQQGDKGRGGGGGHRNALRYAIEYNEGRVDSFGQDKSDNHRQITTGREHRGSYDISSFARMKQATQPVVKARLGLTREIQSLLSAIRR